MNHLNQFNYIEERLCTLATRIETRGKLNILDLHIISENFYRDLFNLLFLWDLKNLNDFKQNAEAIDLVDKKNKIIIQVSATATKSKIESSLTKDLSIYVGFRFKFISISKDATVLRSKTFSNPHNLKFSPNDDIYDVPSILKVVFNFTTDKQREIYEFIKKELGTEPEQQKIETNLASVINILAKENFDTDNTFKNQPFEVEKKIEYNELNRAKSIIDDYKIYHPKVDGIYSEFDKGGYNKSKSVLESVRRSYSNHKINFNADKLFAKVFDDIVTKIGNSSNYEKIPFDELELCVNIIMVDAFIRCKIFENPNG